MHGLMYRLRRKDQWPSTQAQLTSYDQLSAGGKGGSVRRLSFTYRAADELQSSTLKVDSFSSLYNLEVGDTFDIQVDPAKPDRIYSEEAQSLFNPLRIVILAIGIVFALFVLITKVFGDR